MFYSERVMRQMCRAAKVVCSESACGKSVCVESTGHRVNGCLMACMGLWVYGTRDILEY